MKIVADENIPLLDAFFADIGQLVRVNGRNMTAADVADADILLVRSVTSVNANLLNGSRVKFVGTATIGTDHIDLEYLSQQGIGFASAPGCNAQAVVDYVLSAISILADARGRDFADFSVGIIGVGNVGGLLRARLQQMGLQVMACDPFKAAADVGPLSSLDDVLEADIVTCHTPLTIDGPAPTHHLINAERLAQMKADACLINASRGAVVDNAALLDHCASALEFFTVLDVWESEPEIDQQLLNMVDLGTPHIAGYSLDGKMRGTEMIYQALCQHFGIPQRLKLAQFLPEPGIKSVQFSEQVPIHQALRTAIRAAYEIRVDDGVMRAALRRSNNPKETFDFLRKNYPLRRDTPNLRVSVPSKCHELRNQLTAAGFCFKNK